jgi:hypothetical protein
MAVRTHIESSGGIYRSPPDPQVNYGGELGMRLLLLLLRPASATTAPARLTARRLLTAAECLADNILIRAFRR